MTHRVISELGQAQFQVLDAALTVRARSGERVPTVVGKFRSESTGASDRSVFSRFRQE